MGSITEHNKNTWGTVLNPTERKAVTSTTLHEGCLPLCRPVERSPIAFLVSREKGTEGLLNDGHFSGDTTCLGRRLGQVTLYCLSKAVQVACSCWRNIKRKFLSVSIICQGSVGRCRQKTNVEDGTCFEGISALKLWFSQVFMALRDIRQNPGPFRWRKLKMSAPKIGTQSTYSQFNELYLNSTLLLPWVWNEKWCIQPWARNSNKKLASEFIATAITHTTQNTSSVVLGLHCPRFLEEISTNLLFRRTQLHVSPQRISQINSKKHELYL